MRKKKNKDGESIYDKITNTPPEGGSQFSTLGPSRKEANSYFGGDGSMYNSKEEDKPIFERS